MRVAPARETAHSPLQSSSFGPTLSNHGASIAPAGPLCTGAETVGTAGRDAAGGRRCPAPRGQVRGRWEEFVACGRSEPSRRKGRAGPGHFPPLAGGGGEHPPGSHSGLRADDARPGLLRRVKAFVTRTGLCCASSGKRKFGKRLERSIGCAGVNGGTLVGGDWRIMKVEWKQAV